MARSPHRRDEGQVRVQVGGREVVEWACGERSMRDAWGVAVGDAVVRLEGLVGEPPQPAKK